MGHIFHWVHALSTEHRVHVRDQPGYRLLDLQAGVERALAFSILDPSECLTVRNTLFRFCYGSTPNTSRD